MHDDDLADVGCAVRPEKDNSKKQIVSTSSARAIPTLFGTVKSLAPSPASSVTGGDVAWPRTGLRHGCLGGRRFRCQSPRRRLRLPG
jgi:hypothetical protein